MNDKEILLVEDNRDDEALTLDALGRAGVVNPVKVVRDGAEALDYLFGKENYAKKPCLVMLDLKLPKISGLEVLKRIRDNERTRRVPVVILTTSSEPEDLENSYDFGANGYVRKPVEFDRFSEAVRQLGLFWILVNESVD